MLPTDEFAFTGQVVHDPLFTLFLYVPGAHAAHVASTSPVYPELHMQPTLVQKEFADALPQPAGMSTPC